MERIGGEQEGEGEVGEMESSADDSSNALQCFSLLYAIPFLFSLLCIRLSAVQFTLNCSLQKCAVFSKCGVLTAFHTGTSGVGKYAKYSAACSSVGSQ